MLNVHFNKKDDLEFEIEGVKVSVTNEELDKLIPLLIMKTLEGKGSKMRLYQDSKGEGLFSVMDLRK